MASFYSGPVRKRMVTGAIAAVLLGVAAYVLFQPQDRTVEYHKREFLNATYERGLMNRMSAGLCGILGKPWRTAHIRRRAIKIRRHGNALIAQGFLTETFVAVSNRPSSQVASALRATFTSQNQEFIRISVQGTNLVRIIATADDLPKFEELLHGFDVPQNAR